MNDAVIGLSSNAGDRIDNLRMAINMISKLPKTKVTDISNIYELNTDVNQDKFLHLNIMINTHLSPSALLGACMAIESCMGKSRKSQEPSIIDIDILIYSAVRMDTFELTLPHPRMLERAYVLKPLLDLFPTGRAPGMFFLPKLNDLDSSGVELYEDKISLK